MRNCEKGAFPLLLMITTPWGVTHVAGAPQITGVGEQNLVGQRWDERHKPGDLGLRTESRRVNAEHPGDAGKRPNAERNQGDSLSEPLCD